MNTIFALLLVFGDPSTNIPVGVPLGRDYTLDQCIAAGYQFIASEAQKGTTIDPDTVMCYPQEQLSLPERVLPAPQPRVILQG